ncbi:MAG: NAD-dependent epimerase/dehydratase family protein [Deferrisomatales bacterium]|nr:NAD-dependent epimerase/dehydratase family protein [Deferrisomatales bacterium]
MAILITGGSGFIGASLAREFSGRGERVVLVDVKPPPPRISALPGVSYVRADVANLSEILNVFSGTPVSSVFHLAAILSAPSEENPWSSLRVNGLGTFNILDAARLSGAGKLLFTSSMGTYSVSSDMAVDDDTAQRPTLIYGVGKVFGELLGLYYQRKFGLDFRGIRFPQLVGPGVLSGGFGQYGPRLIEAAARSEAFEAWVPPETTIPMLYIKDAVRSLVLLHDAPEERIKTRVYNVGQITPAPTAQDIVEEVRRHFPGARLGFAPDPKAVEVLQTIPKAISGENARKEWGWTPAYSLAEMVRDFIEELMSNSAEGSST